MSSFAGQNLFASGPHEFRFGAWERATQRRSFAGVDGELVLDLGRRSRAIHQTGRLEGVSAAAVAAQIDAINACCDGAAHTLVDNHQRQCLHVRLERFEPATPILRGRGFFCEYVIEYRQLP
jgi:hypothetical protein